MIHALLAEQGSNASEISYHVGWCGFDPWYLDDPVDEELREAFYTIGAIPVAFLDGDSLPFLSNNEVNRQRLRDSISTRLAVPSRVWLSLRAWVSPVADTLYFEVTSVADTLIGPGHRLYMAAAEIHEHYDYYGEFYAWGAMQGMYPDGNGQPFTHSGNTNDTLAILASFAIPDSSRIPWALDNLRLVAWVQNTLSKEVLQSGSLELSGLYSPGPGDTVYVGIPDTIHWAVSAFDSSNVTIEINRDYPAGPWETLFENTANDGNEAWMVTAPLTDHARLRILAVNDSANCDTMWGDFTISLPADVVVSPNPIVYELLAGEWEWFWVTVENIGSVPAYGSFTWDPEMVWGRPHPQYTHFETPVGGIDSILVRFDATEFVSDTVLHGSWIISGNMLPFEVPVTLVITVNAAPDPGIPLSFSVSEAYPNPFNPSTTIRFTLEKSSRVKMIVYSSTGQTVASLLDATLDAGVHLKQIDGSNWATGIYFLRIDAAEHHEIRKLLLLK